MTIPRRAHFIFAGVITFAVLPGGASAARAGEIVWHDWTRDKAAHIGDDRGSISDLVGFIDGAIASSGKSRDQLVYYDGEIYEKTIELKEPPAIGTLSVAIFSLVPTDGQWDCQTALEFNGDTFDLRKLGGEVGSGKTTRVSVQVKLRNGGNYLKITENNCLGGGVNDSLILEGKITFDSLAAGSPAVATDVTSAIAGNYEGVYAFCKNEHPCDEAAIERGRNQKNNIAVKLWEEEGKWKVRFSPPDSWSNFGWANEAHFVAIEGNTIHFKVDGSNWKTLEFKGGIKGSSLTGKILYNNYIMDGRLVRD